MKTNCIDIFNNYCLEIRNNFQTNNADVLIIKKYRINKSSDFLFSLYYIPFFYLFLPVSQRQSAQGKS